MTFTTTHRAAVTALASAVDRIPQVSLGTFPTPLETAPRLSRRLGVQVLIKRDDLTGLALGGNKVRKLEFLIADALAHGADTIVTTGGSQSNHARLTAAACRLFGLDAVLILDRGVHPEQQGNLLLDHLFQADVRLIDSNDPAEAQRGMDEAVTELKRQGRRPYLIPRGGSVPLGATGYAACVLEILDQIRVEDFPVTDLYVGTGSTGTHSGMLAGAIAGEWDIRIQGISVSRPADLQASKVQSLAGDVLDLLGLPSHVCGDDVRVNDQFRGPGYGIPTPATLSAIEIAAQDEALVLDPVYTGKVMAGLIEHARQGRFSDHDTVVFVHTGGSTALFAYNREVSKALSVAR